MVAANVRGCVVVGECDCVTVHDSEWGGRVSDLWLNETRVE